MRQARKSRKKPAKRRAKAPFSSATPVAVKASEKSSQATIPVAIQTTGDSAEAHAIIPVEVQTATGKSVTRAARVPVRVRTKSNQRKSTRKPHPHARSRHRATTSRTKTARQLQRINDAARRDNLDPVAKSIVVLTTAEETVVNVAGSVARSVLSAVPRLLQSTVRLPFRVAGKTTYEAEQFYGEAKDFAEELVA